MKSGNKSIRINGKSVEVTDEVYKVYTKYDRKMRYFEKDLKQERLVYDELGNIIKRVPSREDSLDRLLDESFMQFKDISENVEDIHFYVNICGFHITEFFNEKHPMLDTPDDFIGDGNEGMFVFQKEM